MVKIICMSMIAQVSLLNIFCNFVYSNIHFEKRLAIATQGTSKSMTNWIETSQLYVNNLSHFFFLSFDKPIDHSGCMGKRTTCIFASNTTWTSGRNLLIKNIYEFEQINDMYFKYWSFYDGDAISAKCHPSYLQCKGEFWCCLDIYAGWLLEKGNHYALVFLWTVPGSISSDMSMSANVSVSTLYYWNCPDAAFNSFHRHAVPALLPYIETLDSRNWWYSQVFLFNLIVGCIPGYSVTMKLLLPFTTGNAHKKYPQEKPFPNSPVAIETLKKSFGKLKISPPVRIDKVFINGRHDDDCKVVPHIQCVNVSEQTAGSITKAWLYSERFQTCLSGMHERFQSFVKGHNVDE